MRHRRFSASVGIPSTSGSSPNCESFVAAVDGIVPVRELEQWLEREAEMTLPEGTGY
jgi:hypothetical protein